MKSENAALEAGFPNAEKPDSQDICFIPSGRLQAVPERTRHLHGPEPSWTPEAQFWGITRA